MSYCKEHPKYKAVQKPRSTTKYPDGCPECWKQYSYEHHSEVDGIQIYCGGCEETLIGDIYAITTDLEVTITCPLCGVGQVWDIRSSYY